MSFITKQDIGLRHILVVEHWDAQEIQDIHWERVEW
jgi:hypothetical protein